MSYPENDSIFFPKISPPPPCTISLETIVAIVFPSLVIVAVLLIIYLFHSSYREEAKILKHALEPKIKCVATGVTITGNEENGWKHNFPGPLGLNTVDVHFGDEFALFIPKSLLPFVFKTHMQPFMLVKDQNKVRAKFRQSRIGSDRVYKPTRAQFRKGTTTLLGSFRSDAAFGSIRMHLDVMKVKRNDKHLFQAIIDWSHNLDSSHTSSTPS